MDLDVSLLPIEDKRKFAKALLKHTDKLEAAKVAFCPPLCPKDDLGLLLHYANYLPNDMQVLEATKEILAETDEKEFLPTRRELVARLERIADDSKDNDQVMKAVKMIADICGHVSKPGSGDTVSITQIDNSKVMVIKDHGTDEEWEVKAKAQQKKLIADAKRTTNPT